MSLGIVVKGSEGLVLAADSRVTLTAQIPQPNGAMLHLPVNFDNATKLLTFADPHQYIGAVTYGDAVIGIDSSNLRTAKSFIPEFEVSLTAGRLGVLEFSKRLSSFFMERWTKGGDQAESPGMVFVVAGFDQGSAYGSVYQFNIPHAPEPIEQAPNEFGITMGGQPEITSRIVQGYDVRLLALTKTALGLDEKQEAILRHALAQLQLQIPFPVLPLQDCIDLAVFLIKTTSTAQNLSIGVRGVGGAVDVAVITQREGLEIVKQKNLFAKDF